MFRSARVKLTAWYLLIIMMISGAFSVVIYRSLAVELDRFAEAQRLRTERRLLGGVLLPDVGQPPAPVIDPDLIEETKNRLALSLVTIDGFILIFSGGIGYFLAGRTLRPIKEMVDEQNQFISDASHELRTPLTSLKSAMEVYLRDKRPNLAAAKSLVSDSLTEVGKMQSLSDSLLQLAQFERPNNHTKFEAVSLTQSVREAIHKVEALAKEKQISVKSNLADIEVIGDKYSLIDLFVILLDNAIKYSPARSGVLVTCSQQGALATVTVEDHGTGIDSADLPHIFDRFYRSDRARSKTSAGGYGLGLSIAKKIVDTHGGTISVKSTPAQGSTFSVNLPIVS